MTVSILVDNDVVVKLARLGCFVEGMAALGRKPNECGSIFAMLRYMGIMDASRRARLCPTESEQERLQTALNSMVVVELTDAEVSLAAHFMAHALSVELDLDEGEVMLLAVAMSRDGLDIATGDKRALRALAPLARADAAVMKMQGRFYCLEEIFVRLARTHGQNFVRQAIARSPKADTTISAVFERVGSEQSKFVQLLQFVMAEQIEHQSPGWLKKL